jgi:hypothetical protein
VELRAANSGGSGIDARVRFAAAEAAGDARPVS